MVGFEPTETGFADLRLNHSATCSLAEAEGIEPPKPLSPTVFKTASSTNRTTSIAESKGIEPPLHF
jgi:hypothetical protein